MLSCGLAVQWNPIERSLPTNTTLTTPLFKTYCLETFPSYFHLNKPLTKNHPSFRTTFLETIPSFLHVSGPPTNDLSSFKTTFLETFPS